MSADLNKGVWFQSACSGLYYGKADPAGGIRCVLVNGTRFYPKPSGNEQTSGLDRAPECVSEVECEIEGDGVCDGCFNHRPPGPSL